MADREWAFRARAVVVAELFGSDVVNVMRGGYSGHAALLRSVPTIAHTAMGWSMGFTCESTAEVRRCTPSDLQADVLSVSKTDGDWARFFDALKNSAGVRVGLVPAQCSVTRACPSSVVYPEWVRVCEGFAVIAFGGKRGDDVDETMAIMAHGDGVVAWEPVIRASVPLYFEHAIDSEGDCTGGSG